MENKPLFLSLFFYSTVLLSNWTMQENTAPKVEINTPTESVNLKWNTKIPYRISIKDQEDGNSEYDEINSNEVVLTTTYFSDTSDAKQYINERVSTRSDVLAVMATANCFTCHKAKDKLIGPSFQEIANTYSPTPANKDYLLQKISAGSKGIWGNEIMPAQLDLEEEKIEQILDWIFKNAKDPNFTFYTGTEGVFKTRNLPTNKPKKAIYVVHAQYLDHGLNDSMGSSKKGKHTLVLQLD